jgi:hypothetical protein
MKKPSKPAASAEQPRTYKPSYAPRLRVTNAITAELTTLTGGYFSDNKARLDAAIIACIRPCMMYIAKAFTAVALLVAYSCASQNGNKAMKRARLIATHSCL